MTATARPSAQARYDGLRVVDLGAGMAAALVARQLADAGADVHRCAPDGDAVFDTIYPAHRHWRRSSCLLKADDVPCMLGQADVCIVGGEDHPDVQRRVDADDLHRQYPRLIILHLGRADRAAVTAPEVDILAQARSGLVNEQWSSRPICFAMPIPSYGAALLGLIGIWSALIRRLSDDRGELIHCSLEQGIGLYWSPFWMSAEQPDAVFSTLTPKDCKHLTFQCADGRWIQFVMGLPGAVVKLYGALGVDRVADPNDYGTPKPGAPIDQYFGDLPLIAAHVSQFPRDELLRRLRQAGLPAEPVLQPGECWQDEQVAAADLIATAADGSRMPSNPLRLDIQGQGDDHRFARPQRQQAPTRLPLAGYRIVDMGNFVAGPFASRLLGELGADVIKVEGPAGGATISGARTIYSSNVNKRSVCIDLKQPEGLAIVQALCRTADAAQHNFRVGTAQRLGIAATQLRACNPDLVTLETTAYGSGGPKSLLPGFDMVMQALVGHMAAAGGEGNPPLWIRSPLIDYSAGALGAVALLMGLYQRATTGAVVEASTSLLATALFLQSEMVWSETAGFGGTPRLDADLRGRHPAESLYETRSGWIAVAARNDAMAGALVDALGLAAFPLDRMTWADAERRSLADAFLALERDEAIDRLRKHGVWCEACVEDGWSQIQAGQGALGRCAQRVADRRYGSVSGLVGTLLEFADTPLHGEHVRAAPTLGEHTHEVLSELGYSEEVIADLIARGICRATG